MGVGIVLVVVWFVFMGELWRLGWLYWGLEIRFVRVFRMRDLIVVEDMC